MLAPCPYPWPSGTAVCIRGQARALTAQGHTVHVVSYGDKAAAGAPTQPFMDGQTACHRVAGAWVRPKSGPQGAKLSADWRLWRYAAALGDRQPFDVIAGHHVEGMGIGALLRRRLGLPLVGFVHTQLGLELPSYVHQWAMPQLCRAAGYASDSTLWRATDALVTLSVADAARSSFAAPPDSVFVRHPALLHQDLPPATSWDSVSASASALASAHASVPLPASLGDLLPYAIYSGNADGYQNLGLLCAAARLGAFPLVLATHGPALAFDCYPWPPSARVVRVESYQQMRAWLAAAAAGLSPRLLPCGYPIKWLNYWEARLTVVATEAMGRAVFGAERDTAAPGPIIWTKATAADFAAGIRQALGGGAKSGGQWTFAQPASYARVFAAAHENYRLNRLRRLRNTLLSITKKLSF